MIVFAACVAVVAFVVGMAGTCFFTVRSFSERLIMPAIMASTTFLAVFSLGFRDRARYSRTFGSVRRSLLARADVCQECNAGIADVEDALLAQTRQAVAEFFDVPLLKICPTCKLYRDLKIEKLEPGFQFIVIDRVLGMRNVAIEEQFIVSTCQPQTFADVAIHIQGLIQSIQEGNSQPKALPGVGRNDM